MRRSAGLSALRHHIAACDSDRAKFLLHAVRQEEGDCDQRAQRARAEDARSVQGRAWTRLRLLLGQDKAGTADDQDQERSQGLSDGTPLDDQPLIWRAGLLSQSQRLFGGTVGAGMVRSARVAFR